MSRSQSEIWSNAQFDLDEFDKIDKFDKFPSLDWASQNCRLTFETVALWGEGGGLQTTARYVQSFYHDHHCSANDFSLASGQGDGQINSWSSLPSSWMMIITFIFIITMIILIIILIPRHENLVIGGDAGGHLTLATVPRGGQQVILVNTPPGAKLGVCRRTIYSKLSTSDHNLFQIFLRESKFFFEHQIFLSLSHCRGIKRKVGAGGIGI